jgi:diguanylate cyclase (GGDEF)-like protein
MTSPRELSLLDGHRAWYDMAPRSVFMRTLPFMVMAIAIELSLALPPGPTSSIDTVVSVVLLVMTAVCFLVPWRSLPRWSDVALPLCYVGSVLVMILAGGSVSAGFGIVLLLPVLWTALNQKPWKTAIVILAVGVSEVVTSFFPTDLSDSVRLRRIVVYMAVGAIIAYAIHEVRFRMDRVSDRRETLNDEMALTIGELDERDRASSVLSNLGEMLNFCDDLEEAYEVFEYSASELFQTSGFFSILNQKSNELETVASWHGFDKHVEPFSTGSCLALQNKQPYESNSDIPSCPHLLTTGFTHALCQPLLIRGEIVGILTISLHIDGELLQFTALAHRYARLLGDEISNWLVNFKLRENLENLSIRDPLTNLFNRRFMLETLHREISITTRSHDQTSILQMDVDHFKTFNDSYGHETGDAVLRAVADVLLGLFRDSDVPCRSGGEEFTLILPRCSWDIAHARAVELQARLAKTEIPKPFNRPAPQAPTISIGIATSPQHGLSGEELLRAADKALYEAKSAGRNRIVSAALA